MSELPACPECQSALTYPEDSLLICPECAHEWSANGSNVAAGGGENEQVTDANGNPLANGDTVTLIKNLKVKGSSAVLKVGTKVKNIRLVGGNHDIDCKIDGIGAMKLKSQFVKKA